MTESGKKKISRQVWQRVPRLKFDKKPKETKYSMTAQAGKRLKKKWPGELRHPSRGEPSTHLRLFPTGARLLRG